MLGNGNVVWLREFYYLFTVELTSSYERQMLDGILHFYWQATQYNQDGNCMTELIVSNNHNHQIAPVLNLRHENPSGTESLPPSTPPTLFQTPGQRHSKTKIGAAIPFWGTSSNLLTVHAPGVSLRDN
jgi:hypothetical protein